MKHSALNIVIFIITPLILFSSCQKERKTVNISGDNWTFHEKGSNKNFKAKVPGSVHMDLLANGEIPDPYYRTNEDSLQWIGEKDWVYETTFDVDPDFLKMENIDIVFKGLDTYADVYLNNVKILSADNFFREWREKVKELLTEKNNKLKISFTSPVKINKYRMEHDKIPLIYEYAYTRKPAYHFGWDWGPVFITQGIWQPVLLEGWNKAKFTNFHIYQEALSEKEAKLILQYEIESDRETPVTISAVCNETGQKVSDRFDLRKGINKVKLHLTIENPELWWPNGLGKPNLYSFTSEMQIHSQTVDVVSDRTGLRTVKLVREPDSLGESFYFEVNGQPVYMKGANYIPQDMFLNRPTEKDYKGVIKDAKDANMNMLRVWGGGFYEKDIFYDLCDENGLLVWQDFMFACAMYPGDETFLNNVKEEAVQQVKRLRNHPCIALWCGNNEIYEGWNHWGWQNNYTKKEKKKVWDDYLKIFEGILADAVNENDPQVSYWPSSPLVQWTEKANTKGDAHYWGVWHGQYPFEEFKKPEHIGRFVSEFGFQSLPEFSSVEKFTQPGDWDIHSAVMLMHQKHRIGYPVIDKYMKWYYRTPKDFQAYIYVSQIMQAFGMDMGIEAHRRYKPNNMGTLYWQLNDCYPVASWSSVDYYDKWKAMHYKVRDVYKTFLVSPVEENGKLNVYVVSDNPESKEAVLSVNVYDFNGKLVNKYDKTVKIPANSSAVYFSKLLKEVSKKHRLNNLIVMIKLISFDEILAENEFFFVYPKDLDLNMPEISFTAEKISNGYKLTFKTNLFAKNVALSTDDGEGFFTKNYFELLPGMPVTLTLETDKQYKDIHQAVKVYSLVDSY